MKYENRFTEKTSLFRKDSQTFNTLPARSVISSSVHQFCKPKSSCFMRETAVKRIGFFLEFLILYEVYISEEIQTRIVCFFQCLCPKNVSNFSRPKAQDLARFSFD